MSNYAETLSKHRRLAILRHLAESSDYTSNVSILSKVLQGVGVSSTRDQVITEIGWLVEQGFATQAEENGLIVATVTVRGVEIASGTANHPGVQRPSAR